VEYDAEARALQRHPRRDDQPAWPRPFDRAQLFHDAGEHSVLPRLSRRRAAWTALDSRMRRI